MMCKSLNRIKDLAVCKVLAGWLVGTSTFMMCQEIAPKKKRSKKREVKKKKVQCNLKLKILKINNNLANFKFVAHVQIRDVPVVPCM